MTPIHPLGGTHPFRAVHALAQAQNLHGLEIVDIHDGALIRLFHQPTHLVFRREGDPGSVMDRQRFDYWDHVGIPHTTPAEMLATIKQHIARKGLGDAGSPPEVRPSSAPTAPPSTERMAAPMKHPTRENPND